MVWRLSSESGHVVDVLGATTLAGLRIEPSPQGVHVIDGGAGVGAWVWDEATHIPIGADEWVHVTPGCVIQVYDGDYLLDQDAPTEPVPTHAWVPARLDGPLNLNRTVIAGLAYLAGAVGVFVVCSIIQSMGDTSMFSSTYYEPDNFILDLLIVVTFYPGWLMTAALAFGGVAAIFRGLTHDD